MEKNKLKTGYQKTVLESFDTENVFSGSSDSTPLEYINDPIIEKLLIQQEKINRFKDICNPGISYGFYHNG